MLERRLKNYIQYANTLKGKGASPIATALYQSRSDRTGNRKLTTADGGVEYARFLSNSVPSPSPVLGLGTIGATGFIDQKPA